MILSTAVCLLALPGQVEGFGLTQDFLHGFETGVFVRDDDMAFYDYSCQKPAGNSELRQQA